MLQSPVLMVLQANQVQLMGGQGRGQMAVYKEAVTKNMVGDADNSTAHNTHH